jgi:hypothetical protein
VLVLLLERAASFEEMGIMSANQQPEKDSGYTSGGVSVDSSSDTLQPLSGNPQDKGLYVVTTYEEFFKPLPNGGEESVK